MQFGHGTSPATRPSVEARRDTLLIQEGGTAAATPPGTDSEGRGPGCEQRSRSRCTKENARLQELGHGGGGASGMAERPALRGREQPTLSGGRGPPGHLQLSMLAPLLSFLRAPGPACAATRCRACLRPLPAPALASRSRQASAAPQPPWQPAAPRDGISRNSHHKPPLARCGLAPLSCFPPPQSLAPPAQFGNPGTQQEPQRSAVATSTVPHSTGTLESGPPS